MTNATLIRPTTENETTTDHGAMWQAWREYSDRLAVELAIDAASRRIASAYGKGA